MCSPHPACVAFSSNPPPAPLPGEKAYGAVPPCLVHSPEMQTGIFALFRQNDLGLVYLNAAGWKRIDPDLALDLSHFSLPDLLSVAAYQLFQSEMLLKARIMGRWEGESELRDAWGSPFNARIALTTCHACEGDPAAYLCLRASPHAAAEDNTHAALADRELLHALMNTIPDSVYFKDRSSRFLRVSRSLAQKFGCSDPREVIGKTDFDFFGVEHASAAFNDEQRILATHTPLVDREEKETWTDDRVSWVSTTKLPLLDSQGEVVGIFGISHDITATKKLAEERRDMELQLQLASKLESIGRLAAGVAHEINTPTQYLATNLRFLDESFAVLARVLAAHQTFVATIASSPAAHEPVVATALDQLRQADADSDLPYLLQEIPTTLRQSLEGLDRVTRIVRSLKEFSHPGKAGKVPLNLNLIVDNALTVSRHEWKYVAEVRTELAPDLPLVPGIADQIGQVLLNLIVNAAHAIGDSLKTRTRERGLLVVATRATATHAIVEIQDDGTGIPPEIREKIFEPFFTTKPVGKGTGQGLALAKTIVETNHGGSFEVTTVLGQGTTFKFLLPLEAPQLSAPQADKQE